MKNLPLLDIPYNLFRLEIYDMIIMGAIPAPLFFVGAVFFQPLMLSYPFAVIALFVWVRNKKKDKRYGYMQRYTAKLADELRAKITGRRSRIRYA
ncbi:hypothetical protein [Hydrogenivirga sp.]